MNNRDITLTEKSPSVTVVMPLYNKGLYVGEAIRSVLKQTFSDFELIIIDDGSTDRSANVAAQFCKVDSRIRLIRQSNLGVTETRNRGLLAARGEFVAMIDPDDIALPTWLAAQFEYLRDHPECVVVGCRYRQICPLGLALRESRPPTVHDEIEQELLNGRGNGLTQGCCMMRRCVALEVGGYNTTDNYDEDIDLFLRLALHGKLANLADVHLIYRQYIGSLTHSRKPEQMEHLARVLQKAHFDRGREASLEVLKEKATPHLAEPPDEYYRAWAWNALMQEQYGIAWSHISCAIASRFVSRANWRMVCSIVRRQLYNLIILKDARKSATHHEAR